MLTVNYTPFDSETITKRDEERLLEWSNTLEDIPDEVILHNILKLIEEHGTVFSELSFNLDEAMKLLNVSDIIGVDVKESNAVTTIKKFSESIGKVSYHPKDDLSIFKHSLPDYEAVLREKFPNMKPVNVIVSTYRSYILNEATKWLESERKRISMTVKLEKEENSLQITWVFDVLTIFVMGFLCAYFLNVFVMLGAVATLIIGYLIFYRQKYLNIRLALEGTVEFEPSKFIDSYGMVISQTMDESWPKNHALCKSFPSEFLTVLLSEEDMDTARNLNKILRSLVNNCSHEHRTVEPYILRNVSRSFSNPKLYGGTPKSLAARIRGGIV